MLRYFTESKMPYNIEKIRNSAIIKNRSKKERKRAFLGLYRRDNSPFDIIISIYRLQRINSKNHRQNHK